MSLQVGLAGYRAVTTKVKRAAFGIGLRHDTSPLKGCCTVTFG